MDISTRIYLKLVYTQSESQFIKVKQPTKCNLVSYHTVYFPVHVIRSTIHIRNDQNQTTSGTSKQAFKQGLRQDKLGFTFPRICWTALLSLKITSKAKVMQASPVSPHHRTNILLQPLLVNVRVNIASKNPQCPRPIPSRLHQITQKSLDKLVKPCVMKSDY